MPQLPYRAVREIFERFQAAEPEPRIELRYSSPFTLTVAVALSAQATDAGVNRVTGPLFEAAPTPEAMLALGEARVAEMIRSLGLYRNKARNVVALARKLVEEHGGEVPSSRAALQSLPGVGRKTANVVLNAWFKHPAQAVDTHIFRVCNRTGIAPGRDVVAVERAIEDQVPVEFQRLAHYWLILHGRYTCRARRPLCGACPIADLCLWPDKTGAVRPAPEDITPLEDIIPPAEIIPEEGA